MTAAELLIDGLQERGIGWMATLCGHGLDPLFQAARNAGMRLIEDGLRVWLHRGPRELSNRGLHNGRRGTSFGYGDLQHYSPLTAPETADV